MPSTEDNIWEQFDRIQKGAGFKAKCKACGLTMQGVVERMKNHIARKCKGALADNGDDDVMLLNSGR